MTARTALLLASVLAACQSAPPTAPDLAPLAPLEPPAEAVSLTGVPLVPSALEPDRAAALEADLAEARAVYDADPTAEDALVWYGRRLAYLGRYREAVAVYTRGLELYPESVQLLRHRGHRFITLRELDRAIADLDLASRRIVGLPDEIEPDGAPNPAGIPRSTLHSNVEYHLGLAHFLEGDFKKARKAYERCLAYSRVNDDMLCATTHWLYMTLRRLGREREAEAILEPIGPDMEILENHAYHRLLLFYRGELGPIDALTDGPEDTIEYATAGFGLGHWLLTDGETDAARVLFESIVEKTPWPAFGHAAAEAELARALP